VAEENKKKMSIRGNDKSEEEEERKHVKETIRHISYM